MDHHGPGNDGFHFLSVVDPGIVPHQPAAQVRKGKGTDHHGRSGGRDGFLYLGGPG